MENEVLIYFGAAITGGRDDAQIYYQIKEYLKKKGKVLTEHVGDLNLNSLGEKILSTQVYQRDMEWLTMSHVAVFEVTTPSLGVGYEIKTSETLNKKILCLYRPSEIKNLSHIIRGSPKTNVKEYSTITQAKANIDDFFNTIV